MPAKTPSKTKSASAKTGNAGAPANALVIVESPTKARTIKNFLPPGYTVTASVGHVRDLPRKAAEIPDDYKAAHKGKKWVNYGVNVDEGFEPLYIVTPDKKAKIRELKAQLKAADIVYLATDEDREGESISWHLLEVLQPKVDVKRMVFHEITREAIQQALAHPRDLDLNLVRAQETRRILDRLVGYAVSPILWNKVGGNGLSAGRVQSVALRLIVDRERERLAFKTGSYWDLTATLDHKGTFQAGMVSLGGKRLATGKDFDENTGRIAAGKDVLLLGETEARALAGRLVSASWKVVSVEETPRTLKPYAPFTTSTMQQEANRKLRFSARRSMQVAQRLYENGFITYMRTDSIALSDQAITAAREVVTKLYGADHLPDSPRRYVNKVANAQEAHEAIRPAGSSFRLPEEVPLDGEELALYSLIWKRTVASQMKDAKKTGTAVEIAVDDARFRASGIRTDFAGFLRAYVEGSDDPDAALEDRDSPLPPLAVGDGPRCANLEPVGHETKPPARFTEATLVKALEENGIGRPSTYASILGTIQERGYVIARGQALVPTFVGFAVSDFLVRHFTALVDPAFTKKMEERLDDIAGGDEHWREYLEQFYGGATGLAAQVEEKSKLPATAGRTIELDGLDCEVKIGRFGAWVERKGPDGEVQKANLPDDATPADLKSESIDEFLRERAKPPQSIGDHPETGEPIYLLKGQYGPYLQLGMPLPDTKLKPKRASLPTGVAPDQVTLEMAVGLLSLPRVLGTHPESGNVVKAGLGRFGPFVVHAKAGIGGKDEFRSLKAGDDPVTVTLERAVQLLAEPKGIRGQRGPVAPLREVGEHPSGGPVLLFDGRYGPYVKHGDLIASLPKEADAAKYTLEEAVTLLAERGKLPKSAKRARSASARTSAAKGAKKKTATKRPRKS